MDTWQIYLPNNFYLFFSISTSKERIVCHFPPLLTILSYVWSSSSCCQTPVTGPVTCSGDIRQLRLHGLVTGRWQWLVTCPCTYFQPVLFTHCPVSAPGCDVSVCQNPAGEALLTGHWQVEWPGGRLLYYRECQCSSVVLYSISSIPAQWSPSPHCPTSAVVRPPCPGCCWSPPPTDCTYHRPKVRAPDCMPLWCHCAVFDRVIFF